MRYLLFLLPIMGSLFLTGCMSRQKADNRLALGCAAAIENYLPEGFRVKDITNRIFGESEIGSDFRVVMLEMVITDDWIEQDKEYRCIFEEKAGFSNHVAALYQLRMDGRFYGQKDGRILGSFQDHLKLTETVDRAMNGR